MSKIIENLCQNETLEIIYILPEISSATSIKNLLFKDSWLVVKNHLLLLMDFSKTNIHMQ